MDLWKECKRENNKIILFNFFLKMLERGNNKVENKQNNFLFSLLGLLSLLGDGEMEIYIKKLDRDCYKVILFFDFMALGDSLYYLLKSEEFKVLEMAKRKVLVCSFFYFSCK